MRQSKAQSFSTLEMILLSRTEYRTASNYGSLSALWPCELFLFKSLVR